MIKALILAILTVFMYNSFTYAIELELTDVIREAREAEFLKQKNMAVADKIETEKYVQNEKNLEKTANEKLEFVENYPIQKEQSRLDSETLE